MPPLDPIIQISWAPSVVRNRAVRFDQFLRERILEWEYIDKAHGADHGKLIMDNTDLSLFDLESLKAGNRLYVQWGYAHSMHPIRAITIEKIKGFQKLTIEGTAFEAKQLNTQQRIRVWENATEFDIADEIATSLGFREARSKMIERGDIHVERKGIVQNGETDLAFLLRIARQIGCTFYITGGVFHFHQRRLGNQPSVTIKYWDSQEGDIIGDPEIEYNVQGRPGAVRRSGHSPRERAPVQGTASNRNDTARPILGEELSVSDPIGVDWDRLEEELGTNLEQSVMPHEEEAQSDNSTTSAETEAEATSEARQRFRASERQSIKIDLTIVGNPLVQADNTIRVEGIGQKFSGNYYVDEAAHIISASGYQTKLKLKRNATSRSRGTGRTRHRVENQGTTSVPAGSDLPYSSEFNVFDCQGNLNIDFESTTEVRQVETTDVDGDEITRWEPRTGQTSMPDPWDEEW